jgi:hypothetical protein
MTSPVEKGLVDGISAIYVKTNVFKHVSFEANLTLEVGVKSRQLPYIGK